jgi:D-serine deaminase-like pyridoxal phosphate-dependent protein
MTTTPTLAESLDEIETPACVVDLDVVDANLQRVAAYTAQHSLRLRPHIKTHKSPRMADAQLKSGAAGVTCATIREAEIMAEVSEDILLAYPVLDRRKIPRAIAVAARTKLTLMVDSADAIRCAGEIARGATAPVGIIVELDVGMRRMGVPDSEAALNLTRTAADEAGVVYRGIGFYPGHLRGPIEPEDKGVLAVRQIVARTAELLDQNGFAPGRISGGSTPTLWNSHEMLDGLAPELEIRPGTYIYNDRTTAEVAACEWADCAFTVLATVVSTSVPGQAVIDAGTKALGREPLRVPAERADQFGEEGPGYGSIVGHPTVTVSRLSEEHGVLDLSRSDWQPTVGERVRVIPNHVCIVTHLFDEAIGIRNDEVVDRWPIAARGRKAVG